MARLDAPRLAGLVGAVVVVAIASIADGAPSLSAASAPAPASTSVVALTPALVAAPAPVSAPVSMPTSVSAPASMPTSASIPTPTHESEPEPAESKWTRFERPRAVPVRGRHIAFDDLRVDGERITGRRADGPFAPKTPTILVHYASWCRPCATELPEVLTLARAFSDISIFKKIRPRLVFVSHDEARGPEALLASFEDLLAKANLSAKDLPPHLGLRADPEGRFAAALTRARLPIIDPAALPSLWILDRHGRLVAHLEGPLTDHERLLADLGGSP